MGKVGLDQTDLLLLLANDHAANCISYYECDQSKDRHEHVKLVWDVVNSACSRCNEQQ